MTIERTVPNERSPEAIRRSMHKVNEVVDRVNRLGGPVPASATAPGQPGDTAHDSQYFYYCVAKDTWKRATLASW